MGRAEGRRLLERGRRRGAAGAGGRCLGAGGEETKAEPRGDSGHLAVARPQ